MATLQIDTLTLDEGLRRQWVKGDFAMLASSQASPSLKRVLAKKAAVRPNRFFGEAYVARRVNHEEGWYCPFKWLTSPSWCRNDPADESDSSEFKAALSRHFPRLQEFQNRVAQFVHATGVEKPSGPDLWLVVNGEHRFIEVKLPGDHVRSHQLAGLALLAKCLPSSAPVSVHVISLDKSASQFNDFVNQIGRHNIQMEPGRACS